VITREEFNEWLVALESGEFEQGKGFLRRNDKYCCIGVFCEKVKRYYFDNNNKFLIPGYGRASMLAPYADISNYVQNVLSILNDGVGFPVTRSHTFAEIAQFLRHKGHDWIIGFEGNISEAFADLPEGFEP
jgi:hypothetical protein